MSEWDRHRDAITLGGGGGAEAAAVRNIVRLICCCLFGKIGLFRGVVLRAEGSERGICEGSKWCEGFWSEIFGCNWEGSFKNGASQWLGWDEFARDCCCCCCRNLNGVCVCVCVVQGVGGQRD